jgi:hypothetical protein
MSVQGTQSGVFPPEEVCRDAGGAGPLRLPGIAKKIARGKADPRIHAKQGFREFQAAGRTIQGYEAMNMIRKGQVRWVSGDDVLRQIRFIKKLFDLTT